jgi:drug/metabolite transporter (DMT)-like permease
MADKKNAIRIEYFLMLIVTFFWAIGHPLGRIITQKLHPFQLSAITLVTGFLTIFIYLLFTGRVKQLFRLSFRDISMSFVLGVLGFFVYQILTFSALSRIPASINAVLISNNVVFIAILSAIFLKEKIKLMTIFGIILAAAGVLLVTFNRGFSLGSTGRIDFLGISFSLLAALSTALYSVIGKKVLSSNDPLIITTLALFFGAVLQVILTVFTVGFAEVVMAGWQINLLTLFLGISMIGISYPLWFVCLKRFPVSQISIYMYLTPVFGVILSLIILNERFSWLFWIGGLLILAAIIITNIAKSRRKET